MNNQGLHTSSQRPRSARTAAALFALAAAAGFWSSSAAAADPHGPAPLKPGPSLQPQDNDSSDDSGDEGPGKGRNPYISGPFANVGGPSTGGGGQQDIGQTLDNVLGGDGIGQSIGDLLGNGAQSGGGSDGIGQAIGSLLGGGKSQGIMGSGLLGGTATGDGQSDGKVPEAVRKGVIRLNRALGDTGYNSDPDSHGAGNVEGRDENAPNTDDDEN